LDSYPALNKNLEIENPQATEAFQKKVSSLNDNGNPVLMIVELK
jgi:hypothetical protein